MQGEAAAPPKAPSTTPGTHDTEPMTSPPEDGAVWIKRAGIGLATAIVLAAVIVTVVLVLPSSSDSEPAPPAASSAPVMPSPSTTPAPSVLTPTPATPSPPGPSATPPPSVPTPTPAPPSPPGPSATPPPSPPGPSATPPPSPPGPSATPPPSVPSPTPAIPEPEEPPPPPPQPTGTNYTVQYCVADAVGGECVAAAATAALRYMAAPLDGMDCDATWDQAGSVTWADLVLPAGKALYVTVTTVAPGQSSARGFFVRPTRLTARWGRARLDGATTASFYLGGTGQFSVEFAPDSVWRDKAAALSFPALMLFVNPELAVPAEAGTVYLTKDDVASSPFDLGPGKTYVFQSDEDYDWGAAQVFKVHDDTNVYFEPGAAVRARIIQTEKKVKNVLISGYGVLENRYPPQEYDVQGLSDDGSMQAVTIYGKNIRVVGVTMLNTNTKCHAFGYCLNLNANWSPLADPDNPFEAGALQNKDPPYNYHKAHCQALHMDGTTNTDFTNCPTSHADGNRVTNVKCMTWQMGQDGLNAGKFGTVEDSFVRVIDDALKPWDSDGIYRNIVIWQLTLGWPINLGWWNWGAATDAGTVIEDIFVIHNHNWVSSKDWPETQSGQCVIGGVYGSGVAKSQYRIADVFVETACSCAVGLEISKAAYNRHLTPEGCVGSITDLEIDGMYVDEDFYEYNGGYADFISGEKEPNAGCTGDVAGEVASMTVSVSVAGRGMTKADVIVDDGTVTNLTFTDPGADPFPVPTYATYSDRAAGGSAHEIDVDGVQVASAARCVARCHDDWSCGCVVYESASSTCWKRRGCAVTEFITATGKTVHVRPE